MLNFGSSEEKNREGKGGKYSDRKDIFLWKRRKQRRKRRNIFGDGKYRISEKKKQGRKGKKIFGERKIFLGGEGKGGK